MKKRGILNAKLAFYIAALGHKDIFMIGDAGMPVPMGIPIIDLIVNAGVPTFEQVTNAILEETEIEFYTLATEIKENNPRLLSYIKNKLPDTNHQFILHEDLKKLSADIKFAVRTGEYTPYPNIILRAGVAFPD